MANISYELQYTFMDSMKEGTLDVVPIHFGSKTSQNHKYLRNIVANKVSKTVEKGFHIMMGTKYKGIELQLQLKAINFGGHL